MFRPARLALLLFISALITAGLYLADSDAGTDNPGQVLTMTALVFLVTTILYAAGYGLIRSRLRHQARIGSEDQ